MAYSDPVMKYISALECISISQAESVDMIKDRNWRSTLLTENLEFLEKLIDTTLGLRATEGKIVLSRKNVELSQSNIDLGDGVTLVKAAAVMVLTLVLDRRILQRGEGIVLRVEQEIKDPEAEVRAPGTMSAEARMQTVRGAVAAGMREYPPARAARMELAREAEVWERVVMEELLSEAMRKSAERRACEERPGCRVTVESRRLSGFVCDAEKIRQNREIAVRRRIEVLARQRAIAETRKVLVYTYA